jgi:dTMP kinase
MKKFIVIEGMDGAGTTTQSKLLSKRLNDEKIENIMTREPYEGYIYDLIKNILSGKGEYQKYRQSLTWLYMADRDYHLRDCIKPALFDNKIVISDRYLPSTLAYQSENQTLSICQLYNLHTTSSFLKPDLTIYIRTSVDECLKRLKDRESQDIFENYDYSKLLIKRYDASFQFLKDEGWNIMMVDGNKKQEDIAEIIYKAVKE